MRTFIICYTQHIYFPCHNTKANQWITLIYSILSSDLVCSWHTQNNILFDEYARPKNFNHHTAKAAQANDFWASIFFFNVYPKSHSRTTHMPTYIFTLAHSPLIILRMPSCRFFRPLHWLLLGCFCSDSFSKQQIFHHLSTFGYALQMINDKCALFHGVAHTQTHFFSTALVLC